MTSSTTTFALKKSTRPGKKYMVVLTDGAGRKRRGGVGSGEDSGDERGESTPSGGETMSVVAAARKRGRTLTAASITGR